MNLNITLDYKDISFYKINYIQYIQFYAIMQIYIYIQYIIFRLNCNIKLGKFLSTGTRAKKYPCKVDTLLLPERQKT